MLASAHRQNAALSLASSVDIALSIVTRLTRSYMDLTARGHIPIPHFIPLPFSASVEASDAIEEPPVEQKEEPASNPPPWNKAK